MALHDRPPAPDALSAPRARRATARCGVSVSQTPVAHEDDLALIEQRAGLAELRVTPQLCLVRLSAQQQRALDLRIVQELT